MEINLVVVTWVAIGFLFGRSFGKQIDFKVTNSEWFMHLKPWQQYIVEGLFNFLHHWWAGLILYIYAPIPEIRWFGLGLFLDDWPDIPSRFKKYFKYLFKDW